MYYVLLETVEHPDDHNHEWPYIVVGYSIVDSKPNSWYAFSGTNKACKEWVAKNYPNL